THCRQVAGFRRGPEVLQVVLVIGLVGGSADSSSRARCQVVRVRRGGVVLEGLVVRAVVADGGAADVVGGGCTGGHTTVHRRWPEPALEPAPADAFGVEQITDVAPGHRHVVGVGGGAVVQGRVRIADYGAADGVAGYVRRRRAVGLTGYQVKGAGGRGAEGGAVGVVAQREGLGVVPQGRDGVAVVVVHHQARQAHVRGTAGLHVREFHELVHQAAVEGLLLRAVGMVLVAGQRLGTVDARRVGAVRVVRQQELAETVHARRAGAGVEGRLA